MKFPRPKFWLYFIAILLLCWIGVGYLFSNQVTGARPSEYPVITNIDTFKVRQVSLKSGDSLKINVWIAGNNKKGIVILMPGIGANSSFMTERASLYLKEGFSVLLPDFRATGRSEGDVISFGWNEKLDLIACYRWLQSQGYSSIAAHGCSLGAAAIAYSLDSITDYSFVVMESSYDNIDHAFTHRTFDSGFNHFLFWPAYFFTEIKIGAKTEQLSPLDRMHLYKGPVLYLSGDKEKQIPVEEMQNIFAAIGSANKTLHIFKGAAHEDFFHYDTRSYSEVLSVFLHSNPAQL
ncbi:MAG: hypothetical protein M3R17_16845 [Bacteroidota bacterium]|nr:hypothetical protein [Bacteroidota bacterium]